MGVVSGSTGKERFHFRAPQADKIDQEIEAFLYWWNNKYNETDGIIRAAIAHFWFVTIHPFEDSNGGIARAFADMALARDERTGGLTNKKYVSMTKVSPETAKRDLKKLYDFGILIKNDAKGRSTSYKLNVDVGRWRPAVSEVCLRQTSLIKHLLSLSGNHAEGAPASCSNLKD